MAKLSAWSNVGDAVDIDAALIGKWSVHKVPTDPFKVEKVESFKDGSRAMDTYQDWADKNRQGGVFLVNPKGFLAAQAVWRPGRR